VQVVAEHAEQLDEPPAGVLEAEPAACVDVAVGVEQPLEEPGDEGRAVAQPLGRQVLVGLLAAPGEDAGPLQRVQVQRPHSALHPAVDRPHPRDALDDLAQALGNPVLVGAEVPGHPADLAVAHPVDEGVTVAQEGAEQVPEVLAGPGHRHVAVERPLARAVGRHVDLEGRREVEGDEARAEQGRAVDRSDLPPAELRRAVTPLGVQDAGVAAGTHGAGGDRRQVPDPVAVVRRRQGRLAGQDVPDGHDLAHARAPRLEDRGRLAVHGDDPVTRDDVLDVPCTVASAISTRVPAAKQPGPTPAFTPSAPASTSAWAPSRVAMLPASTCTCRVAGSLLSRLIMSSMSRAWPLATSGHEDVDAGLDQRRRALPGVAEVADGRADEQAPVGVLRGVRVLLGAHEVLDGDEAGELAGGVDQRQPLALVLAQDGGGVVAGDADRRGDERHRRHHVGDQRGGPLGDRHEPQVAVGDHAEQGAVVVDDRAGRRRGTRRTARRAPRAWPWARS
jgi:hypothetical protein